MSTDLQGVLARCELIIFDCDGVLVDTEPLTNRLLAEIVTEAGWPVTPEESVERFKGNDLNVILREVEARVGRELPELLPAYRGRMFAAFESEGVPPIDGAAELLDALDGLRAAGGPRRCVATNGPMNKMHASMASAGLLDRFSDGGEPRLYSAYEVGVWKPAPDLFLHAAERMDVEPGRCIVIEDSVTGVQAANAAGMPVLALAGLTPAETLAAAGPCTILRSLDQVRIGFSGR
ncbi:MAG: HAD family hydrolase [Planctomycetota bacterium]